MENKDNVKEDKSFLLIALGIFVGIALPGVAILLGVLVLWVDINFGGRTARRVSLAIGTLFISAAIVFYNYVCLKDEPERKIPAGIIAGILSFWNASMILIMVFMD